MAKKMSYTCPKTGKEYTESYWHVVQTNLNHLAHTGKVVFHGYANAEDRGIIDSKPNAVSALTIGVKEYIVDKQKYDAFFSPAVLALEGNNLPKQSYDFADSVEDVSGDGDVKVSFFANAEDV